MMENGNHKPRLIFWEVTKGCNLRCIHCRATAKEGKPQLKNHLISHFVCPQMPEGRQEKITLIFWRFLQEQQGVACFT